MPQRGIQRLWKKGKIIWNNLHSFKGNVKHFTAGLLLFLCYLSCLSCQKSFPAYRSSGSILLHIVCPSSSRALGLWSRIPFAIWLKIGGCWDKPGSWQWGLALSFFFLDFVLLLFNMGTHDPSQKNCVQELEHSWRCKNFKGEENILKSSTSWPQLTISEVLREANMLFSFSKTHAILASLTVKVHCLLHNFLAATPKCDFRVYQGNIFLVGKKKLGSRLLLVNLT